MLPNTFYLLLVVACLLLATSCSAFGNFPAFSPFSSVSRTLRDYGRYPSELHVARDLEDSADSAEFLELSPSDIARLSAARSRCTSMPILILEPLLPGQRLQFGSPDPKFHKLIAHALSNGGSGEIGMLGLNPHTGRPLNMGVTVRISPKTIRNQDGMLTVEVKGGRPFECEGEPWMDQTESFYIADVEVTEDKVLDDVPFDAEDVVRANTLSAAIPNLMESWIQWMVQTGTSGRTGIEETMKTLGPMPEDVGKRSIWIASLLNPVPAYKNRVCLEIRPAMLACKTDLERINLAAIALQSSIDHLSGKRSLF